MTHIYEMRVYYEDTDFAGVVYYANYFKFTERARSEAININGINQKILLDDNNEAFMVRKLNAEFYRPAKFQDKLIIETQINTVKKVSFCAIQSIYSASKLLFQSNTLIVFVRNQKLARLPENILSSLNLLN